MCSPVLMANHHPKVAALAKSLSYRKGDLLSLQKREDDLLCALGNIRSEKEGIQQEILRLSALIEAFKLAPQNVRGIRATPRKLGSVHGLFRGTLAKVLKGAGGPITTSEILVLLQTLNDPRINLPECREMALHKIARDIRTMSGYGVVIRHDSGGAGQPATWLWIGDATDQESS